MVHRLPPLPHSPHLPPFPYLYSPLGLRRLLFTVIFMEAAMIGLLLFKTPLRKLVIMALDRLKRGRGHIMVKTIAGTVPVLLFFSLYSMFKIQRHGIEDGGVVNPTDQVPMAKHLLEATLMAAMTDEVLMSSSANYDYADALGEAILFFEGQRSGKLPTSQRVTWSDSALSDGNLQNVNLVGGYYDAGDNVKFGWQMAFTVSLLSWASIEYESGISSVKQLGYLHNAIRCGADFILQAHISPTTLFTQVGDGNADHQCWERLEDMDTARTVYKIDSNSPGTEAAAESAAALSAASIVFKKIDANYSSRLLNQSKSARGRSGWLRVFGFQFLFDFADKYRGSYSASCPFYCSYSGYQDELLWAASWLYKASGENKYLSYIISNQGWSQAVSEFSWDNKFVGAQTLLTEEFYGGKKDLAKIKSDAESFICALMPGSTSLQIKTTPGGL